MKFFLFLLLSALLIFNLSCADQTPDDVYDDANEGYLDYSSHDSYVKQTDQFMGKLKENLVKLEDGQSKSIESFEIVRMNLQISFAQAGITEMRMQQLLKLNFNRDSSEDVAKIVNMMEVVCQQFLLLFPNGNSTITPIEN